MLKQVCDLLAFYVGLVHLKAASAGAGWLRESVSKTFRKVPVGGGYWIVLLIAQGRQHQSRVQAAPAAAVLP